MEYPRIVVWTNENHVTLLPPELSRRVAQVAHGLNLRLENAVAVALRKWVIDGERVGQG